MLNPGYSPECTSVANHWIFSRVHLCKPKSLDILQSAPLLQIIGYSPECTSLANHWIFSRVHLSCKSLDILQSAPLLQIIGY
ncbi:hypothetical protein CDAR_65221 [Caerostris darwini]|uniref:Uncharacterized protein n=1 Tax=Caerostris darwini TaxID=1538125 RepID=A0AAV4V243_9ARAC|nr:hypothetical protein CDAR_65221 [Caerostris darwini]